MLNSVNVQGNLTKDPVLNKTKEGTSVLTFNIAVNRDKAEEEAFFFNCVAWRGTAEFVTRNFKKGQQILVDGHLQSRNYEDKNGDKRTAVEIVADRCYFAGPKKQEESPYKAFEDEEDLPF